MVGRLISHYKIVAKLGEGATGVVYKAEDQELHRPVALKVLPREAANDESLRARFQKEAEAAAALDHPNIPTIYEVVANKKQAFIVMAFVEGTTLAETIRERPLPIPELLRIASETAAALVAAHERGAIHRDIRPGNIMLTSKRGVQVMDFGLAHLAGRARITKTGTLKGGPAYMSPEQARGKPVDQRTDLWSLGVVLYEMLTARPPFGGDSDHETLRAICTDEPKPVSALRADIPLELERIIARCLRKAPRDRYQHTDEVLADIRSLAQHVSSGNGPPPAPSLPPPIPQRTVLITIGLLAAALIGVAALAIWSRTEDAPAFNLELNAPPGVAYAAFSLSPDGTRVAFIGEGNGASQLWVQSLTNRTVKPLEGTRHADPVGTPFWSPDGEQIGFFADHMLKRIPADGGNPQTICDAPYGRGGAWNQDGLIVFAPHHVNTGLSIADVEAGTCEPLLELENGNARSPQFFPDGEHFLFSRILPRPNESGQQRQVVVRSLDSDDELVLLDDVPQARYYQPPRSGTGYLLYVRDEVLLARPLDPGGFTFEGPEAAVAAGVGYEDTTGRGLFAVSPGGVLAFLPPETNSRARELGWFQRDGEYLGGVLAADRFGFGMHLGPGSNWAIRSVGINEKEIEVLDLRSATSRRFAAGFAPVLSSSGRAVYYTSAAGLVTQRLAGGEARTLVPASAVRTGAVALPYQVSFSSVSVDRGWFVFERISDKTGRDVWRASLSGRADPAPFLDTTANEGQAQLSRNGRWIAYVSDEKRRREVYISAFPAGTQKLKVSSAGGHTPRWRSDSRELYYIDLDGMLRAVALQREGVRMVARESVDLFPVSNMYVHTEALEFAPTYAYDVASNGQRFLVLWRPPDMSFPALQVLTKWESVLAPGPDEAAE